MKYMRQSLEPRFAIFIGEGIAAPHLVYVCRWVMRVGIDERCPKLRGQGASYGGLAGARGAHDDHGACGWSYIVTCVAHRASICRGEVNTYQTEPLVACA